MNKSDKIKAVCAIMAISLIIKAKKTKTKTNQSKKLKTTHKKILCQDRLLSRVPTKLQVNFPATEIKLAEPNFCGLSNEIVQKLMKLVGPLIGKQDTAMREAIPVTTRLYIALRYLTTGCSFYELADTYDVSKAAVSKMIPITMEAIYKVFSKKYLKGCSTVEEWQEVSDGFYDKWQFPMCLGAIDGKHIAIRTFSKRDKSYRNYKGSNSMILLAVVDSNYKFIMVDVKGKGSVNGAEALDASVIGDYIQNNYRSIPPDEELPGTDIKVPYVFVSNDTFNFSPRILQLYNETYTREDKIYNYRLSQPLQVVEKAFSMIFERFKILQQEIKLSPEKAEFIILACCALHNFLLDEGVSEEEFADEENNVIGLEKCPIHNTTDDVSTNRQTFSDYFNKQKVFFIDTK